MSSPTKVDVVIGSYHFDGFQFGDSGPISVSAGAVVATGDIITVDGKLCKVTNAVTDQITDQANRTAMHINIYTAPIEQ